MKQTLKQAGCEAPCLFLIRSHDENEVVENFVRHVKGVHGISMTRADAVQAMKVVA